VQGCRAVAKLCALDVSLCKKEARYDVAVVVLRFRCDDQRTAELDGFLAEFRLIGQGTAVKEKVYQFGVSAVHRVEERGANV